MVEGKVLGEAWDLAVAQPQGGPESQGLVHVLPHEDGASEILRIKDGEEAVVEVEFTSGAKVIDSGEAKPAP